MSAANSSRCPGWRWRRDLSRPFAGATILALGLGAASSAQAGLNLAPPVVSRAGVPGESVGIPRKPTTLAELAAASDLVFRGTVESLETVMSEPTGASGTRLPYTLVRYRVQDVLHGMADGSSITLRCLGGIDPRSGLLLLTSVTPEFVEGDEDILFVHGNGTRITPLVGDLDGRVRVIDGRAMSETGRPIIGFLDFRPALRPAEAAFADDLAERVRVEGAAVPPAGRFQSARVTDAVFAPDMSPAPPPVDLLAQPAQPVREDRLPSRQR